MATWLAGGGGGIARIQRGTIQIAFNATSNTATLAVPVDVNRSRLVYLGLTGSTDATIAPAVVRVALTNASTVTATVNTTSAGTREIGFEVIEYRPGVVRSVQRGTITTTADVTGTATITSVNTSRATLDWLGFESSGASTGPAAAQIRVTLTNATTVTATGIGSVDRTVGFQVVEWN